jgi:glycosyl transferase family 2
MPSIRIVGCKAGTGELAQSAYILAGLLYDDRTFIGSGWTSLSQSQFYERGGANPFVSTSQILAAPPDVQFDFPVQHETSPSSCVGRGMVELGERISMLISILICTRNRPEKLRRTLDAICALEVPSGAEYEVLVMENGPETNATAETWEDLESVFSGRLQRFHLPVSGKSSAANSGFAISRGEIISFLDDDILPRKDWLSVIFQEFASDS